MRCHLFFLEFEDRNRIPVLLFGIVCCKWNIVLCLFFFLLLSNYVKVDCLSWKTLFLASFLCMIWSYHRLTGCFQWSFCYHLNPPKTISKTMQILDQEEETKDFWGVLSGATSLFSTFVSHEFGGHLVKIWCVLVVKVIQSYHQVGYFLYNWKTHFKPEKIFADTDCTELCCRMFNRLMAHILSLLSVKSVKHISQGYSKDAFPDIVLRDSNFRDASKERGISRNEKSSGTGFTWSQNMWEIFFWHRTTVTIQLLCYCVPAPQIHQTII